MINYLTNYPVQSIIVAFVGVFYIGVILCCFGLGLCELPKHESRWFYTRKILLLVVVALFWPVILITGITIETCMNKRNFM